MKNPSLRSNYRSLIIIKIPEIKVLLILVLLAGAVWLVWRPQVSEAQAPQKNLFVHGFVAATVQTEAKKSKDIYLPNAKVFLVSANDLTHPVASALTDLSGRFALKTKRRGNFTLCVEADGFPRFCEMKEFPLVRVSKYYSTLRLPLLRDKKSATAYGEVTFADGSRPRSFEPFLDVNAFARVALASPRYSYNAYVNNFGEYIVPAVPVNEDFVMRAKIEGEVVERSIRKASKLRPGLAYPIDLRFRNRPPQIRLMSASSGGKRLQMATPGSSIVVNAVSKDHDRDRLEYRWMLPNGTRVGPTTNPELPWTVPARRGRFPITVVVSDGRGGYARDSFLINADTGNVPFSGRVVDPNGAAVNGAPVNVNGRQVHTDNKGRFNLGVPLADRYVMTVRSPVPSGSNQAAYGMISFVYTGSIVGGRWTLRPAQVYSINPTKYNKLEHKRSEKDCKGSFTSKMDLSKYRGDGLIEWQDGRGNVRPFSGVSQDAKKKQEVAQFLEKTNLSLPRNLAALAKVRRGKYRGLGSRYDYKKRKYDYWKGKVPCSPGIQLEIPAHALENTTTKRQPSGNVQVVLSTVDLTSPGQMPGNYSAFDANNNPRSMESFGAGSVEIRSGNERFNLKANMEATMIIPVDATQRAGNATPPATIPFLYYDEQKGVWLQDGEATLTGSGANAVYKKQIKHFSTMNADILKTDQACVAVELDPAANFELPLNVEVTMQPSVVNPDVIQVRALTIPDATSGNVIYNLPVNQNIVLTPIVSGTRPDGSTGDIAAGVFVVNTGGPQTSPTNEPSPNPDGTYYAETNGVPTGPCGSRVTLKKLDLPAGIEFLQGFNFQATNITEQSDSDIADDVELGAANYYAHADASLQRQTLNQFRAKNRFGLRLLDGEIELNAQYANSGDLGFGRDMHCRRNAAADGLFDFACFVTNFGQPPANDPDQLDADHALAGLDPNATVAMEFSRVELADGSFPDNDRAVKFYVYGPDPDGPLVKKADLDGHGERPVPQLCVICHGGNLSTIPLDLNNPDTGPQQGAFADRDDIMSMGSNFLPFDLHFFNFPADKSKEQQQAAFKSLNREIVRGVAAATPTPSIGSGRAAIVELIDTINPAGEPNQLEDAVIANWDGSNSASQNHRFYKDVFARACRTCHVARPFSAPVFTTASEFREQISSVQSKVCEEKVMPHAQRTNDIFWRSINPSMPGFLQLYGQTLLGWVSAGDSQCGLEFQAGNTPQSLFESQIYPILTRRCDGGSCHSGTGRANFAVGGSPEEVYNLLLTATARDGSSNYIVPFNLADSLLFQRLNANPGPRMPLGGGGNLMTSDRDNPADGIFDGVEIESWITGGAGGP